ncbi:MAG: VOC family protein [Chlorobiaceae bacterium]|nr:VOC family protein [Chlorobiaceae bacterium]NTW63433.1 VOC family protein [Chlorobiaceae bacterium]
MMKLTGINQITLRVNDLRRAEQFYADILGFRIDHHVGVNICYLRLNSDMLVLVKSETPSVPESRDFRVDHFGFRLASDAEVNEAADYLDEKGVHLITRPAHRQEGRAFFVMDPDGNLVEFYSMHNGGIDKECQGCDSIPPDALAEGSRSKKREESDQKKPRRSRK